MYSELEKKKIAEQIRQKAAELNELVNQGKQLGLTIEFNDAIKGARALGQVENNEHLLVKIQEITNF